MKSNQVIGTRIERLLQTPPESAGVWVKEFGPAFSLTLVAKLDNGMLLRIGEYSCAEFEGNAMALVPAQLVQKEHDLSDVEGKKIMGLADFNDEFGLELEGGLFLTCESSPGGNYPLLFCADDIDSDD